MVYEAWLEFGVRQRLHPTGMVRLWTFLFVGVFNLSTFPVVHFNIAILDPYTVKQTPCLHALFSAMSTVHMCVVRRDLMDHQLHKM